MTPSSQPTGPQTAIEALRADLDRLAEAEDDARLDAKVAQSKAAAISRQRRNIEKALRLVTGASSESLTKKTLEELVARALSKGPLPEKELRDRLESHLKEKQRSINGLGLLMAKIRTRYATDDGRWALSTPEPPVNS